MAHNYGPKPEPLNRVEQAVEMALVVVPAEKLVLGISAPSETAESHRKNRCSKTFPSAGHIALATGLVVRGYVDGYKKNYRAKEDLIKCVYE